MTSGASGCGMSGFHSTRTASGAPPQACARPRHTCRPGRTGTAGWGSPAPGSAARGSRAGPGWSNWAAPGPGSAGLTGPASRLADLHRAGGLHPSTLVVAFLVQAESKSLAAHARESIQVASTACQGIQHSAAPLVFMHMRTSSCTLLSRARDCGLPAGSRAVGQSDWT